MAVIELDLDAPPASAPSRAPAPFRLVGLVVAVVLALALGGAAPVEPVLWQQVGVVQSADPDASFVLTGDRLYIAAAGPDGRHRATARSAGTLDELWSTGIEQPASPGSAPGRATLSVVDGGLLLTGSSYATAMIDAGTGTVRWTEPVPVQAVGAGLGVRQETHFRPGTDYDRGSGAPGELFWSSDGRPHTEPPRRTTVLGIDLTSGRRLWADDERGSVRTLPVPGDAGLVVVASSDQLTLRAARTGAVLRRAELPPTDGVSWVDAVGDLLLLRRGWTQNGGTVAAYEMNTLRLRWQHHDPPNDGRGGTCDGLPCRFDRSGRSVLDPATGVPLWRTGPWVDLTAWDGAVLELESIEGTPIRLADRATGATRVPLRGWDRAVPEDGGPLLLSRDGTDFAGATFGLLKPGGSRVQPLGPGPRSALECAATGRYVACRTGDAITVWSYRA